MNTAKLKSFAQAARRQLMQEVAARLEHVTRVDSAAHREKSQAIANLHKEIGRSSRQAIIERAAYTWFNRLCALRFMDVNRYTRMGVVSPAQGFTQPEILAEAKQGHISEELHPHLDRERAAHLLSGRIPSPNPQQEAYRMLLVAVCNLHHERMPFLFQKIHDYTELLLPDDLLSENSIVQAVRLALTPESCTDVEVIGWLYQFYISEKKDEVFEGLKKNKKITPENIPASTQLFTPHWIVRYLVENSLGRLWMLNRPKSRLIERMDYYIRPEQAETDFLRIDKPEEIKICDPACGSGHMLVYAFDLLHAMYEEDGYDTIEIPQLILENNLFGVEIDERAGELAAFALFMKAREKDRRFFRRGVQPNVCVLKNVHFTPEEIATYMDAVGQDLFTLDLQETLHQFEEADNFGSLIRPKLKDIDYVRRVLEEKKISDNWILHETNQKVLCALKQAEYLSPRYHVVIANPPYMGGKGMNPRLGVFAKENFPDSNSDLFGIFIERNLDMALSNGFVAMITMQSWMFLSSFEKLRAKILFHNTILSMAHLGAHAFDSIGGEVVQTTAFVLEREHRIGFNGIYLRLIDGMNEAEKKKNFKENRYAGLLRFENDQMNFSKITGKPILYGLSSNIFSAFMKGKTLSDVSKPLKGFDTGGNGEEYIKLWYEIEFGKTKIKSPIKGIWVETNKGGGYRKWYGNRDYVTLFGEKGEILYAKKGANIRNKDSYFKEGITYSVISSSDIAFRWSSPEAIFYQHGATCIIDSNEKRNIILGLLNSKVTSSVINEMCPTLSYTVNDVAKIPVQLVNIDNRKILELINIAAEDWNSYETSWGFQQLPLLRGEWRKEIEHQGNTDRVIAGSGPRNARFISHHCTSKKTLSSSYQKLRKQWGVVTIKMKALEEENNSIFIKAYGLQDELTPEVPLNEITLTCNPYYRYGYNKSEEDLEALLLADTMKEFISYAVGCMFGRYSLDKPGLILANQGETIADYLARIPQPSFAPDEDNVLPILDGEWFTDDIVGRFREFLRVTFGDEHYEENMAFIEQALGKDIRKYFLKDFYNDHVKRYKKRPIYWLFSSPKGSFNALIYMHRYRPDTVSVILNGYLRDFRAKLAARKGNLEHRSISASSSQKEKAQAIKELEKLGRIIEEIDDYERDVLYPLAVRRVEIDLDDGVKKNYPKFGQALKKIPGLEEKEE